MNIQKSFLALAIISASLSGCGTEEQDNSSNTDGRGATSQAIPGIAVDGPVVRATVYADLNNNLIKDSFEPSALTDNNGYFSADTSRGVSYCSEIELTTFEDRPEFCLDLQNIPGETNIIVTGGYDLYTGEPFEGSLSIPFSQATSGDGSNGAYLSVTPLSSIAGNSSEGSNAYLADLGITDGNLNLLDPSEGEEFNAALFESTYQMHKFVSVINDWLMDYYPEIGEDEDFPTDASALIYQQFQNLNEGNYEMAVVAIEAGISEMYQQTEIQMPAGPGAIAVAQLMQKLNDVSDAISTAFGDDLNLDNVKARMRGVEVVVIKILRGSNYSQAQAALSDANYLESLNGDSNDNGNINFTQLVEFNGSAAELATQAVEAAQSSGTSLSALSGKYLTFATDGTANDDGEIIDSSAAIFFTGDETQGQIHLCLQYDSETESNYELDGNYIGGEWETLAALNNTVMLRLDLFGGITAVLKKVGLNDAGDTDYRFDYDDNITHFSGSDEFLDITEGTQIPDSDEACVNYLGLNL
ncbi:MAG: hypothetical protein V7785_02145 [Bermanella sp.]